MSIKNSQAILKCFIDLKNSVWFTMGSEDERENIGTAGHLYNNVFNTLTGSQAKKSFKCHKTWFRFLRFLSPA